VRQKDPELGDDFSSGCHFTVGLLSFKNGFSLQLCTLCQELLTAAIVHIIRGHVPDAIVIMPSVVPFHKSGNLTFKFLRQLPDMQQQHMLLHRAMVPLDLADGLNFREYYTDCE